MGLWLLPVPAVLVPEPTPVDRARNTSTVSLA